jgi:hypothetical protein
VDAGTRTVRVSLSGYVDQEQSMTVPVKGGAAEFKLAPARGSVFVDTAAVAIVKVNGTAVSGTPPFELSLLPGIHRIQAELGNVTRTRVVNVKPGSKLKLHLIGTPE